MVKETNRLDEAKKIYSDYLRKKSMFFTKERQLLLEHIFDHPDHFSADELIFSLQQASKKISRATVYRSLSQMVEAQILEEVDFGHGHSHYEFAVGGAKHIHLICRESEQVKEVHSEELTQLLHRIAEKENFEIKDYSIQLYGIQKS